MTTGHRICAHLRTVSLIVFGFLLAVFVAGCGGSQLSSSSSGSSGGGTSGNSGTTTGTTQTSPPPTVSISASPSSVNPGNSSTLVVSATNATKVTVAGSDGSSFTMQSAGGTQVVQPTGAVTYTATATGAGGTTTAQTSVNVAAANAVTVGVTASPMAIAAGSSSILTVTATNASGVTISGSDGSSYTLTATGGTQAVKPASTTTYTAKATASSGTGTATSAVTVTVGANPPPTVSISANPASVLTGSSSMLKVMAAYATQVTISGSDGSSYTLQSDQGGTQSVTPTKTTTYTAVATGPGGSFSAGTTVTVTTAPAPTVKIVANPTVIVAGNSATLTVTAANATDVTITGNDGSSYTLPAAGGTQSVSPASTTAYTATATGAGGSATASATVSVTTAGSVAAIDHVIFMMQENHTFDNYFGMLNPYRETNQWTVGSNGVPYTVDGIDDKLTKISNTNDEGTTFHPFKFTSTCVDDMSSAWLESYGDVNTYDFAASRGIDMNGFVHNAEGFANSCNSPGATCSGSFTDTAGQRAMGYYDQTFLNYYYYMASQFAVSDRWFSPISTNTIDNRIATLTGGTTQGLTKDPGDQDHLSQLDIDNIFEELDQAKVSWKLYYTDTEGYCTSDDDCNSTASDKYYPATTFEELDWSFNYVSGKNSSGGCDAPKQLSSVVGDTTNSFCIDPTHIAPLSQFFTDLTNGTLPSFAWIDPGYGLNDEHPGTGNNILSGQAEVAKIVNAFMASSSWSDSVFFLAFDEGGGPYDHVPPVPGHSNENTDASVGSIPDISSIAVNPDTGKGPSDDPNYWPCVPSGGTPTLHCDLGTDSPGANPTDAAAEKGYAAQLGFRVPNMIISPFTIAHYVGHNPMDHTAIIKFVENRFIGPNANLTFRDAAQPNLLDFFDFTNPPWATPPTPPVPASTESLGYNPCNTSSFAP